jgi:SRSO17 transposase
MGAACRLYLPEIWASDAHRHEKVGVPDNVVFQTKPQIALRQTKNAQAEGVSPASVLADAGYGAATAFLR